MGHQPNRYVIGVKANKVAGATFVKYRGDCYYRLDQQGMINTVPTSAVTPFYPVDPCFESQPLTSIELKCGTCFAGELQLYPESMIEIQDRDYMTQFRFHPEKDKDFGEKFIKLSRDVHFLNDDRAKIKLEINNHTGSKIKEIKEYTSY